MFLQGSGCSLQCRTYVGTPLPWPYLHLLVTLVCISSLLISVLAGLAAAKFICCISSALTVEVYVSLNTRPRLWEAVQRLVMHLVFLFVLPTFYHGLVNLAQRINTPFGFVRSNRFLIGARRPVEGEAPCFRPWMCVRSERRLLRFLVTHTCSRSRLSAKPFAQLQLRCLLSNSRSQQPPSDRRNPSCRWRLHGTQVTGSCCATRDCSNIRERAVSSSLCCLVCS